jgi:hypothetical protein
MISKTTTYLNKALGCDAILIATALNPCYWLSLIQKWFPESADHAESRLENICWNYKLETVMEKKMNTIRHCTWRLVWLH